MTLVRPETSAQITKEREPNKLEGLDLVTGIIGGYQRAGLLFDSIENDVFTHIAKSPDGVTVESFAERLGIDSRPSSYILACLKSMGLITQEGDSFRNSPPAEAFLVRGADYYMGEFAKYHAKRLKEIWENPIRRLKEGAAIGKSSQYEKNDKGPVGTLFEGLHERARVTAEVILGKYDFSKIPALQDGPLLDLGGATAAMDIQLVRAHPFLHTIVFDRAHPLRIAREKIQEANLEGNIETMEGDFLTDELPKCGAILASRIHCDKSEEVNMGIIQRGYRALLPGGEYIVCDFIFGEDMSVTAAFTTLNLCIETNGESYPKSSYVSWLESAGFKDIQHFPMDAQGGNGLLIGHKV